MKNGIKITIYDLLLELNRMLSREKIFLFTLLHTSIPRKQVKISFVWLLLKHQIRDTLNGHLDCVMGMYHAEISRLSP